MKKIFETPAIDVLKFALEDIMTASGSDATGEFGGSGNVNWNN